MNGEGYKTPKMKLRLTDKIFLVCCFAVISHTFPVNDEEKAVLYLQKYGYLENSTGYRTGAILGPDSISSALKDFQRFAGLNQTGELDNDTIIMMNTPRCGVKDRIRHSESARKKRYALQGTRWRIKHITYRIRKYPTRLKDKTKIRNEFARAFKIWSDVSGLSFEEMERGQVSINLSFERGEHGDGDPFDGPGKTLAHSYYPQYGGYVHFDDDENWTINETKGTDLFQAAAHEFGHSLGLSHSGVKDALMFPYSRGYNQSFRLHPDDIEAIQSLYGPPFEPLSPDDEEPEGHPPDLCQDATIDTITRTQNGRTYLFKGNYYWEVLSNGIADGYPRKITDDWDGLQGNLDASLTWANGKTYFFKGRYFWRFTNKEKDGGYPRELYRGFEGIPDELDAAVVWTGNNKTYFFKGNEYWRYDSYSDPPVSDRYPRPISNWRGLPADGIDAAFQWENGRTYFFKGNKYYRFNDVNVEVDTGTPSNPRSTSEWWFDCKSASQGSNSTERTLNGEEISNRDNATIIRKDSNS